MGGVPFPKNVERCVCMSTFINYYIWTNNLHVDRYMTTGSGFVRIEISA